MNELESPQSRATFAAMPTVDQYIRQSSYATEMVIRTGAPVYGLSNTVFNCEYSTVSGFAIWLQEHGVSIPADICAELEIEVRNA